MSSHGYGPYSNGCRCEVCRAAKREYMASRRATGQEPTRYGEAPVPEWSRPATRGRGAQKKRVGVSRVRRTEVQHGTTTGYRRGCRCWECTDRNSAAGLERQRRRRAERLSA